MNTRSGKSGCLSGCFWSILFFLAVLPGAHTISRAESNAQLCTRSKTHAQRNFIKRERCIQQKLLSTAHTDAHEHVLGRAAVFRHHHAIEMRTAQTHKIGCFLNGCCYGSPTGSSLGVSYPEGSAAALAHPGAKLHPVQLYETAENMIACAVFMYIVRKGRRGAAMSAYLAVYGLCRFVNEFFRGDNPHWWLFTPAQWIGLAMIPAGIVLGIIFGRKSAPNGKAA